jgi:hypothetical protein
MLEGVLRVLDRVIQLLERREKQRTAVLTALIEPMYGDMERIHTHYLREFTSLLAECRAPGAHCDAFRTRLGEKKSEMEAIRVKVHSVAKHHAHDEKDRLPQEVVRFMTLCLRYFRVTSGEIRGYVGHYTDLISLLDDISSQRDVRTTDLSEHSLDVLLHSRSVYGYGKHVPIGQDTGELRSVTTKRIGTLVQSQEETPIPALLNCGTFAQNIELALAYIRILWNEITAAYAAVRASLL